MLRSVSVRCFSLEPHTVTSDWKAIDIGGGGRDALNREKLQIFNSISTESMMYLLCTLYGVHIQNVHIYEMCRHLLENWRNIDIL